MKPDQTKSSKLSKNLHVTKKLKMTVQHVFKLLITDIATEHLKLLILLLLGRGQAWIQGGGVWTCPPLD